MPILSVRAVFGDAWRDVGASVPDMLDSRQVIRADRDGPFTVIYQEHPNGNLRVLDRDGVLFQAINAAKAVDADADAQNDAAPAEETPAPEEK